MLIRAMLYYSVVGDVWLCVCVCVFVLSQTIDRAPFISVSWKWCLKFCCSQQNRLTETWNFIVNFSAANRIKWNANDNMFWLLFVFFFVFKFIKQTFLFICILFDLWLGYINSIRRNYFTLTLYKISSVQRSLFNGNIWMQFNLCYVIKIFLRMMPLNRNSVEN